MYDAFLSTKVGDRYLNFESIHANYSATVKCKRMARPVDDNIMIPNMSGCTKDM